MSDSTATHSVNELSMTPQLLAADIAKELREHPERWGRKFYAQQADGRSCSSRDAEAVRWCLGGLIHKRVSDHVPYYEVFERHMSTGCIYEWNDDASRTVADVIAMCDKIAAS